MSFHILLALNKPKARIYMYIVHPINTCICRSLIIWMSNISTSCPRSFLSIHCNVSGFSTFTDTERMTCRHSLSKHRKYIDPYKYDRFIHDGCTKYIFKKNFIVFYLIDVIYILFYNNT